LAIGDVIFKAIPFLFFVFGINAKISLQIAGESHKCQGNNPQIVPKPKDDTAHIYIIG
jgi:hypothetical protein